jgi:hypothetical protein
MKNPFVIGFIISVVACLLFQRWTAEAAHGARWNCHRIISFLPADSTILMLSLIPHHERISASVETICVESCHGIELLKTASNPSS